MLSISVPLGREYFQALKSYCTERNILRNDKPFRFWLTNTTTCINFTFWSWGVLQFWNFVAIIVPRSPEIGRWDDNKYAFETALFYVRRKERVGATSGADVKKAPNLIDVGNEFEGGVLWHDQAFTYLFFLSVVTALSIFCFFVIKSFLYDINRVMSHLWRGSPLQKRYEKIGKGIGFFIILSLAFLLFTAFCLLYADIPTNGDQKGTMVRTMLWKYRRYNSYEYVALHRLTKLGQIVLALNVFLSTIIVGLYGQFIKTKLDGNNFFFDAFQKRRENTLHGVASEDIKAKALFAKTRRALNETVEINSRELLIPNKPGNIVDMRGVNKHFVVDGKKFFALRDINLHIKTGDFIVVVGPSGSGKTTLINLLSCVDKPSSGQLILRGHNVSVMNRGQMTEFRRINVGYIFQSYALLPNLNVTDNIRIAEELYTRDVKIQKREEFWREFRASKSFTKKASLMKAFLKTVFRGHSVSEEVKFLLTALDLAKHATKLPSQLSGGQQQRVSIARSLVKRPTLLFGDEPTGAIDHQMTQFIMELFCLINKYAGATVIIITHNPLLGQIANRVLHIDGGQVTRDVVNFSPKAPSEIHGL